MATSYAPAILKTGAATTSSSPPAATRPSLHRCDAILAAATDDVFANLTADERRTFHRLTLRALGQPERVLDVLDRGIAQTVHT